MLATSLLWVVVWAPVATGLHGGSHQAVCHQVKTTQCLGMTQQQSIMGVAGIIRVAQAVKARAEITRLQSMEALTLGMVATLTLTPPLTRGPEASIRFDPQRQARVVGIMAVGTERCPVGMKGWQRHAELVT